MGRLLDHRPQPRAQRVQHGVVLEDVGHRRAEHQTPQRVRSMWWLPLRAPVGVALLDASIPDDRLAPLARLHQDAVAAIGWSPVPRPAREAGPRPRVAVVAALADLVAPPPGVPCLIAPRDAGCVAHVKSLLHGLRIDQSRPLRSRTCLESGLYLVVWRAC